VTIAEGEQKMSIPFESIQRLWAENTYDFLGNRIVLCLETKHKTYRITEGQNGFGDAQEALYKAFGFYSDFYEALDHDDQGNVRIVLYDRGR
jgi:hypothetical protein